MKNIIEIICHDFASPDGRNLQERCLESMVLIERFRGGGTVDQIVPDTADADISPDAITHLAEALATFIATFPHHPDVGSATWALGKLREPRFIPLFERVISTDSAYNEFARHQAIVSLEDLNHESTGNA